MSLRVWLPLNGDLRNNGLDNIEVVNNGATVDNSGKIGKCYYLSGNANSYINTNYSTNIGTSDFSISLWVKIPTITSGSYYAVCTSKSASAASSGFGIYWNYSQKKFLWSTADGTNATEIWMAATVDSIVYDKWIHLVMVRNNSDTKKGYFYINGERYELTSIPAIRNITIDTKLLLGKCSSGNYPIKAYYNDVRIYDHALSAKEVKEISKGLVCHYKLDRNGANPNLVPNQGIYTQNNPYILTTNRIDGYKWLPNSYFEVEPSTTYTFSVYCDAECSPKHATDGSEPNKFSMYLYLCNDGHESKASTGGYDSVVNCNSTNNNYKNFGQRHCWTYTTTSTQKYMSIRMNNYGAGTETITHKYWYFKVEKGDKLTTYIPNINDELYSKLNYNSNIIYDSSGYNHHGEMWRYDSLGNIEISSNTPRNSLSTYINSENNTTNTASGTVFLYGNCGLVTPNYLTVAFWCKPIAGYGGGTTQGQFCTTSRGLGIGSGSDYSTTAMHHRDAIIDMCTSTSIHKTVSIAFTANEWHHYAIVYDGRYGRVYKDGVQTSTLDMGSNLSLASFTAIVIGLVVYIEVINLIIQILDYILLHCLKKI